MDQMELLWQYQELDIEVARFEHRIKTLPIRRKLVKLRNLIIDQTKQFEKMEQDVQARNARVQKMQEFYEELLGRVNDEIEDVDEEEQWDPEELQQMRRDSQELMDALGRLDQEAAQSEMDMKQMTAKLKEIGLSLNKAKKEFPQVRAQYDEEVLRLTPELEAMRAKRDEAAAGIEAKLMERYNAVKAQRVPALAKIVNDQCSGCNMSLPSQVVRKVKSAQQLVECENCGRILAGE